MASITIVSGCPGSGKTTLAKALARRHPDWPVSYLLLQVPETEALRRVRERQGPGASPGVRHMVAAFSDLSGYRAHVVPTAGLSAEAVLREAERGLAEERFRLGG